MKAPCQNCPDRKVTDDFNCHSVCEKYLAYQAANEERYSKAAHERELNDYRSQQIAKAKSKIRKFRRDYKYE